MSNETTGVLLWKHRKIIIHSCGIGHDNLYTIDIDVPFVLNPTNGQRLEKSDLGLDVLKLKLLESLGGFLKKKNGDKPFIGKFLGDKIEVGILEHFYHMKLETSNQATIDFFDRLMCEIR